MAKPAVIVTVLLDTPAVPLGGELRGAVEVNVKDSCTCKGLTVFSRWDDYARGFGSEGRGPGLTLFTGTWHGGDTYRYPFVLPTAPGPISYDGKDVKLKWQVRAEADVGREFSSDGTAPFRLERAPIATYFPGEAMRAPYGTDSLEGVSVMVMVLALSVGAIVGLWLHHVVPYGALWALGGGLLLGLIHQRRVFLDRYANSRMGKPRFSVTPQVLAPGQSAAVEVALTPPRPLHLRAARLTLVATEFWHYKKQYPKRTHTYDVSTVVFSAEMPVQVDQAALAAGRPCTLTGEVRIPDDAPCTLWSKGIYLNWDCTVHLEFEGLPTYEVPLELLVFPPPA